MGRNISEFFPDYENNYLDKQWGCWSFPRAAGVSAGREGAASHEELSSHGRQLLTYTHAQRKEQWDVICLCCPSAGNSNPSCSISAWSHPLSTVHHSSQSKHQLGRKTRPFTLIQVQHPSFSSSSQRRYICEDINSIGIQGMEKDAHLSTKQKHSGPMVVTSPHVCFMPETWRAVCPYF